MKKISIFLTTLLITALAGANEGIVYVDLERVYRDSQKINEKRKSINAEFTGRQQALEAAGKEIRDMLDKLEKEAPTLSDNDQEKIQKEITSKERDFRRDQLALVEDRNLRLQELRFKINTEINRLIQELSVARGYKIVLNPFFVLPLPNERTITHNIILYASDEADITQDVVSTFDEKANLDD